MAIEDIFRALEEQADAECKDILDRAKKQAGAIVAEGESKAEEIRSKRLADVDEALKAKTAQIVNSARLENKKDVAALKERVVDEVFSSAADRLGGLRGTPGYDKLFEGLMREALESVKGKVEVHVTAADASLAHSAVSGLGNGFDVVPDLDTSGGLVAVFGEGRIYRRNTFEDRLTKVRQVANSRVAEILFE